MLIWYLAFIFEFETDFSRLGYFFFSLEIWLWIWGINDRIDVWCLLLWISKLQVCNSNQILVDITFPELVVASAQRAQLLIVAQQPCGITSRGIMLHMFSLLIWFEIVERQLVSLFRSECICILQVQICGKHFNLLATVNLIYTRLFHMPIFRREMHNGSCRCHLRGFFIWVVVVLFKSPCLAISCSCAQVDGLSSTASELWVPVVHCVCFSFLFFLTFFGIDLLLVGLAHWRCEIDGVYLAWCQLYPLRPLLLGLILRSPQAPWWHHVCLPNWLWRGRFCIHTPLMLVYSLIHQLSSLSHLISGVWTIEIQVWNLVKLLLQLKILHSRLWAWHPDPSLCLQPAVLLGSFVIELLMGAESLISSGLRLEREILVPVEATISSVDAIYISGDCTVHYRVVLELVVDWLDFILQDLEVAKAAWVAHDVSAVSLVGHPWVSLLHLQLLIHTYFWAPESPIKPHLWFGLCLDNLPRYLILNLSEQRPLCFLLSRLLLCPEFSPIVNHLLSAILTLLIQRHLFPLFRSGLFLISSITAFPLVHPCLRCWDWIDLLFLFMSSKCIIGYERVWVWHRSVACQKHDPFTVAVWLLGVDALEHGLRIHFHFQRLLLSLAKRHHILTFKSLNIATKHHGIHLLHALNLRVLHASLRNVRLQLILALLPPLCLCGVIEFQIYQTERRSMMLVHAFVHTQSFSHLRHLCCNLGGDALPFILVLLLVDHYLLKLEN